jgi:hypothetical protein
MCGFLLVLLAPPSSAAGSGTSISSISKSQPEALISGARMGTPILRASATYNATFSVWLAEAVSVAAIYSAG